MIDSRALWLIGLMFLVPFAVAASDINGSDNTITLTETQFQQLLSKQGSGLDAQAVQEITKLSQAVQQLEQSVDGLQTELAEMQRSNDRMREQFATLSRQIDEKFQYNREQLRQWISEDTGAMLVDQAKDLKENIRYNTNPFKANLPVIAVFMFLTGAFLLWIGRKN